MMVRAMGPRPNRRTAPRRHAEPLLFAPSEPAAACNL